MENKTGNKINERGVWMRGRGTIVATLLIVALFAMAMPAEAKTYYTFAGHSAVRYDYYDMGSPLNYYIEKVEYDTDYSIEKPGVRLYLTSYGKDLINSPNGAYYLGQVTSYVRSRPEWLSDRSYSSVATEIAVHCEAAKIDPSKIYPTHIEYFYNDLKWWEKPVYGR